MGCIHPKPSLPQHVHGSGTGQVVHPGATTATNPKSPLQKTGSGVRTLASEYDVAWHECLGKYVLRLDWG